MRRTLLASVLLFLASSSVFAQQWYPVPHGPLGIEVGFSYPIANAQYSYHGTRFDESTGILTDTSFTKNTTSSLAYSASVGYSFNLAHLSEKSRLALSLSYNYGAMFWDGNYFDYGINKDNQTQVPDSINIPFSGVTIEMGLPVGLDYKWGCDAMRSKTERLCYALGAGAYPSMDLTVYQDQGGFKFGVRPYLRAEAGIFAGICFKLRATYIFGNINYITDGHDQPGNFEEISFSSKGTTVLSLIVMPMSWKFSKGW